MSPAALTEEIKSYVSVIYVLIILGGAMPALQERLMQRVEAALRSED